MAGFRHAASLELLADRRLQRLEHARAALQLPFYLYEGPDFDDGSWFEPCSSAVRNRTETVFHFVLDLLLGMPLPLPRTPCTVVLLPWSTAALLRRRAAAARHD